MSERAPSLLEPGHEREWERLNAEKQRLRLDASDAPVGELLRRGQALSAQAMRLRRAVEPTDARTRP